MSTEQTELNRILEIISKIVKKSADGEYIYRGEPECYKVVSSNLWRELKKLDLLDLDVKDESLEFLLRINGKPKVSRFWG